MSEEKELEDDLSWLARDYRWRLENFSYLDRMIRCCLLPRDPETIQDGPFFRWNDMARIQAYRGYVAVEQQRLQEKGDCMEYISRHKETHVQRKEYPYSLLGPDYPLDIVQIAIEKTQTYTRVEEEFFERWRNMPDILPRKPEPPRRFRLSATLNRGKVKLSASAATAEQKNRVIREWKNQGAKNIKCVDTEAPAPKVLARDEKIEQGALF